ncbi:MAG: hypothetical protein EXS42_05790 [Lacunisphaera sp.]|nr:hypothetical protein [Lacunisphaera sp.]
MPTPAVESFLPDMAPFEFLLQDVTSMFVEDQAKTNEQAHRGSLQQRPDCMCLPTRAELGRCTC